MVPQPVTLTVTVLIDGQHAGSAAQNLIALTEEGALESGILATVRAELATYDALSDWRIVRATVTASQPDDDAGAGIEEDDDDDPPTCPACGSTDAAPLGTLGGLHWRRCKSCGIDYSQPAHDARTAAQEDHP